MCNTYATPLTTPPFKAQTVLPALLMATDNGNSPPLPTGFPIIFTLEGAFGFMLKSARVFEAACGNKNHL